MSRTFRHPDSGDKMPERRNGNGNLTYKWLAPVLLGILTIGGAGWMTSINTQLAAVVQVGSQRGERLATVESSIRNIDSNLAEINMLLRRLADRIESVSDRKSEVK